MSEINLSYELSESLQEMGQRTLPLGISPVLQRAITVEQYLREEAANPTDAATQAPADGDEPTLF